MSEQLEEANNAAGLITDWMSASIKANRGVDAMNAVYRYTSNSASLRLEAATKVLKRDFNFGASTKRLPKFAKVGNFLQKCNKVIICIGLAISLYDMYLILCDSNETQKFLKITKLAVKTGAGFALGFLGEEIGTAIGTAICPGLGTVIGAVVGGLIGGLIGYFWF